jgi:hypothetical protein
MTAQATMFQGAEWDKMKIKGYQPHMLTMHTLKVASVYQIDSEAASLVLQRESPTKLLAQEKKTRYLGAWT